MWVQGREKRFEVRVMKSGTCPIILFKMGGGASYIKACVILETPHPKPQSMG